MSLIDLMWNFSQSRRISDLEAAVNRTTSGANVGMTNTERVSQDVERLALVTRAVWELLRDKAGVTENELFAKVNEIDLRDGAADGKLRKQPLECPQCRRVSNARRETCLYCGAAFPRGSAFDAAP